MKKLILVLCLAFVSPVIQTGCTTAPSARVIQVQTLKAVGETADASVALGAKLYRDGKITAAQARQINAFYDTKFQPVYRVAVASVSANLDSIASPDAMALAQQLSTLVIQLQSPTK